MFWGTFAQEKKSHREKNGPKKNEVSINVSVMFLHRLWTSSMTETVVFRWGVYPKSSCEHHLCVGLGGANGRVRVGPQGYNIQIGEKY